MRLFGANSLFLAPEYLGEVNMWSAGLVGVAISVFIMSWNITTFILYTRHIKFLATTAQPFLKYCINNALLPIIFLVFYISRLVEYNYYQQLMPAGEIWLQIIGFLIGFFLSISISFVYFFGADRTIYRRFASMLNLENKKYEKKSRRRSLFADKTKPEIRVDWFLSARFYLRKPRDVRHYPQEFIESIFKRHHFAAFIAIVIAYLFLIGIGYFLESPFFLIPAAASVTIFFAILIAVAGAFSFFLRNWSLLVLAVLVFTADYAIKNNIIDVRNKAYGLDYRDKGNWPSYSQEYLSALASPQNIESDKQDFIATLNAWQAKQTEDKPVAYIVNVSGGGMRSASFVFNVLQYLDSLTKGTFLKQTILISGSSGGMLGAAYFRELYWQRAQGKLTHIQNKNYAENISKDLLNPLFSSLITRDIVGPVKRFTLNNNRYSKDRGYAFEEQLNDNTKGLLNKTLRDYVKPESEGAIPTMILNAVITRDGRKLVVAGRPCRFLMKSVQDSTSILMDPDAIDYTSFFHKQEPLNTRMLTALRMNATFPYVLPNVWLPTVPVIDVMDGGLRDNYGTETALRFMHVFKEWLQSNTSKIVLVQIRDRRFNDWEKPFESDHVITRFTKPFLLLQNNWYRLQDFYQQDQLKYFTPMFDNHLIQLPFQYVPSKEDASASLSFHLTASEKKDIHAALQDSINQSSFRKIKALMH